MFTLTPYILLSNKFEDMFLMQFFMLNQDMQSVFV